MPTLDEAIAMMDDAWATRRRCLSAATSDQPALINEAHRKLTDAVTICRDAGARPQLAQAIHLLANVERDMGHDDAAQTLWEEAVTLCRAEGDPLQLAHKVRHLGDIHHHLGRVDQAESCYAEALDLYRGHDAASPLDFANAASRMAALKDRAGATDEATALWREARDLYEAAGVTAGVEQCERRLARRP